MAKGSYNISVSDGPNLQEDGNSNTESESPECMNSCLNSSFLRSLSFHDRPRSSQVPINMKMLKSQYKTLVSSSLQNIPSNPSHLPEGRSEYGSSHDFLANAEMTAQSTIYDESSLAAQHQIDQSQWSGARDWLENKYATFCVDNELLEKTIDDLSKLNIDISESLSDIAKPESIALESVIEIYKNKVKVTEGSSVSEFNLSTELPSEPIYENWPPPTHEKQKEVHFTPQGPTDLQVQSARQDAYDSSTQSPRKCPQNLKPQSKKTNPKNLKVHFLRQNLENIQAQSEKTKKNLQAPSEETRKNLQPNLQEIPKNVQAQSQQTPKQHMPQQTPKQPLPPQSQQTPKQHLPSPSQQTPKQHLPSPSQQTPKQHLPSPSQQTPKQHLPSPSQQTPKQHLPAQSQENPKHLQSQSRKNLLACSSQQTLKRLQSLLISDAQNIQSSKPDSNHPLSVEQHSKTALSPPTATALDTSITGKSGIEFHLPSDHEQFIKIIEALQIRCLEYREMIQDIVVLALEECLNFSELSINEMHHLQKQFVCQKKNFKDFKELCCKSVVFGPDSLSIDEKVTEVIQSFYLKLLQEENETFMTRLEFGLKMCEIYAKMRKFETESKKIITTLENEILYLKKTSVGFKV